MRNLLVFIVIVVIYYALKTVFRSAFRSYHEEDRRKKLKGEEMVLDPECRTYVIKDRAVTLRIDGALHSFCSEECARRFEKRRRS